MRKCTVIYNPESGKKNKQKITDNEILSILKEYDYETTIIKTEYSGHAEFLLETIEDCDLVISMGGDGTFNEVMTGNLKREERLVVANIPFGTTNDIATMYGYGKDIKENFHLLLSGTVKEVDIPTINGKPFIYSVCIGKFSNIPYETSRKMKSKVGYLAYLLKGIQLFKKKLKLYDIKYIIDNEEYHGNYSFLIVSNATRIAGINNVYDDVKLNDDQFEILFCKLRTKKEIVKSLFELTKTNIAGITGCDFYRTNNLKIIFNRKPDMSWCVDGEKLDIDTNEYIIKNYHNIKIMIPNKNIDKLFK